MTELPWEPGYRLSPPQMLSAAMRPCLLAGPARENENARGELLRVRVNPEDIGRVIGRSGRTANAIRTVVQALSDHKVRVDIMDVRR